nr:MAG TPA: tail collar fiber protein [Caudoviricetes sp.]
MAESLEYVEGFASTATQKADEAAASAKTAAAAKEAAAASARTAEQQAGIATQRAETATQQAEAAESSKASAAESAKRAEQFAKETEGRVTTDPTLTVSGAPADAKAVGDRINAIKIETDKTLTISGAAADAAAVGGIVLPRVVVEAEAGSSIVLSDGEKTVSGVAEGGSFSAALPHDGEWTVTATLGTGAATETVQAEYCRTKTLTLAYYTLTVTVKAGSTVTAQCGDKTVTGTVPESGSIKLYLPIAGTWTVTATLGDETTEGSVEVGEYKDYPLELAYVHIYGASWDGTSTTKWSRTDEAAEFTDPVPYVAGASSYGSPFDNLQPWAGMVKSERTGGTMVAIPKFWYKLTQNGRGMTIQIADRAVEGYSVSPAHMDRGDGHGERDVVYVGRYHSTGDYKSVTGQDTRGNVTRSGCRSGIHALGATIWQYDFAMMFTIWLLYLVEFADWNSQAKIGYGCGSVSTTLSVGYTDSMPYHTGTTESDRTTYGLGTQYRNIEGLWDNSFDWCDGCYYDSNGLNIILNPANFSDSSGGTAVGIPSNGYPSAFTVKTTGGFPLFIPTAANGSFKTYSCDGWYFSSSYPCLYVGGSCSQNADYGLFYVNYSSASSAGGSLGCRLQELPNGGV